MKTKQDHFQKLSLSQMYMLQDEISKLLERWESTPPNFSGRNKMIENIKGKLEKIQDSIDVKTEV